MTAGKESVLLWTQNHKLDAALLHLHVVEDKLCVHQVWDMRRPVGKAAVIRSKTRKYAGPL